MCARVMNTIDANGDGTGLRRRNIRQRTPTPVPIEVIENRAENLDDDMESAVSVNHSGSSSSMSFNSLSTFSVSTTPPLTDPSLSSLSSSLSSVRSIPTDRLEQLRSDYAALRRCGINHNDDGDDGDADADIDMIETCDSLSTCVSVDDQPGGELNYILIFPVLSMSKWMLPVLLWSVLLTLRFAIAEALQISDFMTAQWRTSSKGKRHLGELDDDLARFLEFLRRNFGTGKRLQSDGKEESDSSILFNQHNHFIHPLLLLTDAPGEVGGYEDSSAFSATALPPATSTAPLSDGRNSSPSSGEGRRPLSTSKHHHHKHHRRQPREMGQHHHHDDIIATWTNFDDLAVSKHQQSNQEGSARESTSNSFPLIEAPLAMSNPFYRILRRAYRMILKQQSRIGSL